MLDAGYGSGRDCEAFVQAGFEGVAFDASGRLEMTWVTVGVQDPSVNWVNAFIRRA